MMVQGKFREALQFADSICQKAACKSSCSVALFEASLLLGEFEKAERYFNQYHDAGTGSTFNEDRINNQIGYVYVHLGKIEEAKKTFAEQNQKLESRLNDASRVTFWQLARISAFQGDRDQALKYLVEYGKKGFHAGNHDFIQIDPFFESLRDDPEFKAIVTQAQNEKAALRAQVREMEERGELDL